MAFRNAFSLPPTDEERERAVTLSGFFWEKQWTVGEAKRVFALWYERVMRESGTSSLILESDLRDFVGFILRL